MALNFLTLKSYKGMNSLKNYGTILVIILGTVIIGVIVLFFKVICPIRFIKRFAIYLEKTIFFNGILRIWLESILELSLGSFINIKNVNKLYLIFVA